MNLISKQNNLLDKCIGEKFLFIFEEGDSQWEDKLSQENSEMDYYLRIPQIYLLGKNKKFELVYSPEREYDSLKDHFLKYFSCFDYNASERINYLSIKNKKIFSIGGIILYKEVESKHKLDRRDNIQSFTLPTKEDLDFLENKSGLRFNEQMLD
jgi:hypothetical protein